MFLLGQCARGGAKYQYIQVYQGGAEYQYIQVYQRGGGYKAYLYIQVYQGTESINLFRFTKVQRVDAPHVCVSSTSISISLLKENIFLVI